MADYITFEGETMREAMDKLYEEGARLNILDRIQIVKKIQKEKKRFIFGKKKVFSIVVHVSKHKPQDTIRNKAPKDNGSSSLFGSEYDQPQANTPDIKPQTRPVKHKSSYKSNYSTARRSDNNEELRDEVNGVKEELSQLRELMANFSKEMQDSMFKGAIEGERKEEKRVIEEVEIGKQNIRWTENFLRDRDFSPRFVNDVVSHLMKQKQEVILEKNRIITTVREFLKQNLVTEEISLDQYQNGNKILLAGPTGVGKTITIVKLAAHLAAMRQKSMKFLSVDRYKVGADSQLKAYAELMRTPFHPIHKQQEFFDLLNTDDTDYIFIDTAGKGPREGIAISELAEWIRKSESNVDVHLVISAGTKGSDLDFMIERYAELDFDHIIATKLDETIHPGSILSLIYQSKKPLSFITNGQEVPQDFEIANVDKLIADSLTKN